MTGDDKTLNGENIEDETAAEVHETAAEQQSPSVIRPESADVDAAISLRYDGGNNLPQNAREELSTDELQAIVDNLDG